MHKVFVCYHHDSDQAYKDMLVELGEQNQIFIDRSVDTGDIADGLDDGYVRELIRNEYLRDSTVTIALVGTETRRRKHVDWEIYSSMYDGTVNKRSGILVINLPTTGSKLACAPHGEAEKDLYPDITPWTSINTRADYERRYPYMPDRLIDNLLRPAARISVLPWNKIDRETLGHLVEMAFRDRAQCEYDLSRPMRRANS